MDYPPCPNPDKVALMRLGAHVRRRLAADPAVHKVPVDRAVDEMIARIKQVASN